ncbi:heme exporter protein CcmB [Vibrio sp.]|uniref:Heme exporter protein B n=1 Tax=Vibrio viridaestus TaxID=2487322 RepID=A0A3N9TJN4_9VIBR|nr:heme exporter protein CcmB [Vibrio viridaestus]MDC0611701.1 heme exporter protein CcmB [Vibrio sp.]RQW64164.1 heme exporter protein CcmB [Vibrio viridaestus]
MSMLMLIVRRELKLGFRKRSEVFNPVYFFLLIIVLFPLGIGSDPSLLSKVSPGLIWIAALLSTLLSLDRLFRDDFIDGSLEQLMVSSANIYPIILGKVFSHWILTGVPLILVSPLFALFLSIDINTWTASVLTLLIGSPVLSFIGAIGVALTLNLKKPGIVLSLLVIPLYLPVLIFATAAINSASLGLPYSGQLAILGAMFVGSVMLSPFVIRFALKISMN